MDIGNPMHRRAPGQVAQTILVAITVAIGNLDILETWLHERTGSRLSDADFDSIPAAQITTRRPAPHYSTWDGISRPTSERAAPQPHITTTSPGRPGSVRIPRQR
ncbi:hypothetical protein [Streptomyces sp. TP-A0875]|uniref:hypothetical protein n=1 Tax=Streptomyces sp. TP-A0875 TaxID=552354 RepID=UPI00131B3871|nr:hypothetical protein [Streptomyces sp. TP-A0875]